MIKEQYQRDEEVCPEKWAEGEVDTVRMTIGEYTEFCEKLRKIRELSDQPHTICRHVKLMREAIAIIAKQSRMSLKNPNRGPLLAYQMPKVGPKLGKL